MWQTCETIGGGSEEHLLLFLVLEMGAARDSFSFLFLILNLKKGKRAGIITRESGIEVSFSLEPHSRTRDTKECVQIQFAKSEGKALKQAAFAFTCLPICSGPKCVYSPHFSSF